jgi:hypothetical protein
MTHVRLSISLLVACLLAVPFTAGAQVGGFDPSQAEGLEAGVRREYNAGGAITLGTPEPAPTLTIQVAILDFDTGDHAHAFLDLMIERAGTVVEDASEDERASIVRAERITTWGDDGYELRISDTTEDEPFHGQVLLVANGEYLFLSYGEGSDESLFATTEGLMTWITETGAPGGEVEYADDGGSTGGLWGFFPPAGDPVVAGLLNTSDDIVFPVPGATPEA